MERCTHGSGSDVHGRACTRAESDVQLHIEGCTRGVRGRGGLYTWSRDVKMRDGRVEVKNEREGSQVRAGT